jgi:hypothetical protein
VLVVVLLAAAACLGSPAAAQRRYLGMGHSLRLEGIVEPAEDADVLGEIQIRAGEKLRRFGVTSAIAPGEDGMAIFRNQTLRRETFKLVAKEDMLQIFGDAPPAARLRMIGVLNPDSLILASIDVIVPAPVR